MKYVTHIWKHFKTETMSKIDHFEKNVAFPLAIRHGEGNTEYKKREKEGNNVTNNTEICFVK